MVIYSKNTKLNKVLNEIRNQLLTISDTEEESLNEVSRYVDTFSEPDYNLYAYGNVLIYYDDIRELYADYKSLENASNNKLEEIYKRQVGWMARRLMQERGI